jgi:hypothetical protein
MGTKNEPGKFDCYSKAEPDEPMFVLLGRDPVASTLVNLWADIAHRMGKNQEKVEEAYYCTQAMAEWSEAREVAGYHLEEVVPYLIAAMESLLGDLKDEQEHNQ